MSKFAEGYDYDEELTKIREDIANKTKEYVEEHSDLRGEAKHNN